jgi:hypothetical protein
MFYNTLYYCLFWYYFAGDDIPVAHVGLVDARLFLVALLEGLLRLGK